MHTRAGQQDCLPVRAPLVCFVFSCSSLVLEPCTPVERWSLRAREYAAVVVVGVYLALGSSSFVYERGWNGVESTMAGMTIDGNIGICTNRMFVQYQ